MASTLNIFKNMFKKPSEDEAKLETENFVKTDVTNLEESEVVDNLQHREPNEKEYFEGCEVVEDNLQHGEPNEKEYFEGCEVVEDQHRELTKEDHKSKALENLV